MGKNRIHRLYGTPGRSRQGEHETVSDCSCQAPGKHRVGRETLSIASDRLFNSGNPAVEERLQCFCGHIGLGQTGSAAENQELVFGRKLLCKDSYLIQIIRNDGVGSDFCALGKELFQD